MRPLRLVTLAALSGLSGCLATSPPSQPATAVCPPCNCPSQPTLPPTAEKTPPPQALVLVPADARTGQESPADTSIVALPGPSGASGWTTFHGSASREGVSTAPHVVRPRIRWKTDIGIQGWLNAPLISGQHVIVPSSGNTHNQSDPRDGVFALDLATGRVAWHAHLAADANGAAVIEDRVVATSDDGNVYGLDLRTGAVAWKHAGQGKMYTTPLVVGDQVVVGDAQGYVRAFGWRDGAPRWNVQMNGAMRGGASSDGRLVYVVSQGGEAAAFSLQGRPVWRMTVRRPSYDQRSKVAVEGYAAPIVSGGLVFVPFARDTYYDRPALLALDAATGRTRWTAPATSSAQWGNIRATPTLLDGALVYAEPYSGDVVAIDAANGNMRWRRTVGRCLFPHYAAPAAAGDVVYVPRFDGVLYAVRSSDGTVLWRVFLGDRGTAGPIPVSPGAIGKDCSWEAGGGAALYSPVGIAPDGTILAGNGAGTLFAIEESR